MFVRERGAVASSQSEGGGTFAVRDRLQRVAVIGNGIMGHGSSQVFATGGKEVVMISQGDARALVRARHEELLLRHPPPAGQR